jgi:hypothetical protein
MLIYRPVDIMAFMKDNSPPTTIILISGDRDFAYLLSTLRWRKYKVVLISNSFKTHESLTVQASVVYDWQSEILKARPPTKYRYPLLGSLRESSPSVAFLATPQELDSPMSDVRTVDLSQGHNTPVTHPLALSPRSVSITTVNAVPDILLVESDATPIPTRVEIPAEVMSAKVPTTPTSDDWIVADLTSESAMVLLSIVCIVTVRLNLSAGSVFA